MEQFRKFEISKMTNSRITGGFWGDMLQNYREAIDSMLSALLCETNSARLLNFEIAAGVKNGKYFGTDWSDGDCYKFLEACCYIYISTKDEYIKNIVDKYVPYIIMCQQEDGYLCTQITSQNRKRWEKPINHELYNVGHFFTFAAAHYEAMGTMEIVDCAKKLYNYLYGVFKDYPPELAHFGFNPSQIMGLCDIYNITKDDVCIKLAEIFVNMRGSIPGGSDQNQARIALRDEKIASGHAVTSTYLYAGAADVYAHTGEKALLEALERIWEDLIGKRIYITGGVCADFCSFSEHGDQTSESHGTEYELRNKIAYNETCANIGAAMWMMRMLSITENTKYADWAEQIMYNAGISGTSLDLKRFFYSNPLSYRKDYPITMEYRQYELKSSVRWHTYSCWCCPVQIMRTLSGISRWVFGENDNNIYINLFAQATYITENVDICIDTNYPWNERVKINVNKISNKKLAVRIPSYCKRATINGKKVESGKYQVISVNDGDELILELDQEIVYMQANPNIEADRGMIAVKRGPLVYCAEGVDNKEKLDNYYINTNEAPVVVKCNNLPTNIVGIQVTAQVMDQQYNKLYYEYKENFKEEKLNLIPYYSWANRENSDMSVWFPKR